ncbi:MAG: hypothetical protein HYV51_00290 [Parcubacteria group bacterium]|nr:hypothetical protein [Parcubacteria group bacterium]
MTNETIKIKVREENQENSASDEISPASGGINWQIEERQTNLNNGQWLWALAIIGFAVIVFSILLKNYLLIIIVVLAAFIIYASKNKTPEIHEFRLDSDGIVINGKFYSYDNFESFGILSDNEIAFRRKHHLMPLLTIPFHSHDESEIKKILENRLPENEEEESFLDLLQKKFF